MQFSLPLGREQYDLDVSFCPNFSGMVDHGTPLSRISLLSVFLSGTLQPGHSFPTVSHSYVSSTIFVKAESTPIL